MKLRTYVGGRGYRDISEHVYAHALGETALVEVELEDGRTVQLIVESGKPGPGGPRDGFVSLRCYGNIPARLGNHTQINLHEFLRPEPATHDDTYWPLAEPNKCPPHHPGANNICDQCGADMNGECLNCHMVGDCMCAGGDGRYGRYATPGKGPA